MEASTWLQRIRKLDIVDLCIISLISEGEKANWIWKVLCLTPAAICHRMRNHKKLCGAIYVKKDNVIYLNETGLMLACHCQKALKALDNN